MLRVESEKVPNVELPLSFPREKPGHVTFPASMGDNMHGTDNQGNLPKLVFRVFIGTPLCKHDRVVTHRVDPMTQRPTPSYNVGLWGMASPLNHIGRLSSMTQGPQAKKTLLSEITLQRLLKDYFPEAKSKGQTLF